MLMTTELVVAFVALGTGLGALVGYAIGVAVEELRFAPAPLAAAA